MTEAEVVGHLRKRYAPPAWAFLPQVRNGTGFQRLPRTADALAMALWPSRGLELIGFEIKTARADWVRELRDAEKAESIFAFCDRWYLVTAGAIVQPGELPAGWGHLAIGDKGCRVAVEAERRTGKDVDRLFLAAILRRVEAACIPRTEIQAEIDRAVEAQGRLREREIQVAREEWERQAQWIKQFEAAAGITLHRYTDPTDYGAAFKMVREQGPEHIRQTMLSHKLGLKRLLDDIEAYLDTEPS